MFSKSYIRVGILMAGTALLVIASLFVRSSFSGGKNNQKMMTVGGKENPCQCTQRIER
ncbi:MAG: hypothetical protein JSS75_02625 [Bacteroidetes bacterium]|nr:hypothetical protein [Bacteroidota bacterium]